MAAPETQSQQGFASVNLMGSSALGTSLTQLLLGDDIEPGSDASYQLCKTLFLYHPLGAKMTESPVKMAMFKPREISVPDSPEERVKKAFVEQWEKDQIDTHLANWATVARVYGVSSLALLTKGGDPSKAIDFEKLWKDTIAFNIFDPLNTAGSLVLSQQPNDLDFLKATEIRVQGSEYHRSRMVVLMNERPIYLGYTVSAFGYVGRSVYQRALFPLKSFIQTMMTDDLVSAKAGVLVAKIKQAGSIIDNMMLKLFGLKRSFVQAAKNYGVISIGPEDDVTSLNMENVDKAAITARKNILQNVATASDMPAIILEQETFAEGFGEGTQDAAYVARFVDGIRTWMAPGYRFMDRVVMYRAWNPDFYATIQADFPEYKGVDYTTAFVRWKNSFTAVWPDLLSEKDTKKAEAEEVKFKTIIAAVEVLAPDLDPANRALLIQWMADNMNALEHIFSSPLELDYETLATYEPQQGVEGPGEPRPFSSAESDRIITALLSRMPKRDVRRLSRRQESSVQ